MATSTRINVKDIDKILKEFSTVTRAPEKYISIQNVAGGKLVKSTKHLFDFVNKCTWENHFPACPLDELLIDGFDEEQIWQEIELHNDSSFKHLLKNVSNIMARKDKLTFKVASLKQSAGEESSDDEYEEGLYEEEDDKQFDIKKDVQSGRLGDEDASSDNDSNANFNICDLEGKSSRKEFRPQIMKRTELSKVDDIFFKLSDMEQFLEMEDAKEAKRRRKEEDGGDESQDESDDGDEEGDQIMYFEELPPSSGEEEKNSEEDKEVILSKKAKRRQSSRNMMYKDFFPDPNEMMDKREGRDKQKVHFKDATQEEDFIEAIVEDDVEESDNSMEDKELREYLTLRAREDSESEGEDVADVLGMAKSDKSSFEKRQEKFRERIKQLEQSNISEKPWQMVGEVTAGKRPENSLLEERLDFEVATRPAPVVTEETTQSIEDLIKQRIKDMAWDDVERRIKPREEAFEFKKKISLNQEKSKMSLGEIYEQEYIKKIQKQPEEEEEDPAHAEIKKMMDSLFVKLDALSNFHFTPKPIAPDVKIVSSAPAITMEEVQPISVTDAALLAPEEIKAKSQTELKGASEKTVLDRKQERRKKKIKQRLQAKERARHQNQKSTSMGWQDKKDVMDKLEKASTSASSKTIIIKNDKVMDKRLLTSSKSFFGKLQEEAATEIKGLLKNKQTKQTTASSNKFML